MSHTLPPFPLPPSPARALFRLSFPGWRGGRAAQESRKHYNQLEEARKQQHARKLKLEAQEVALGERDRVTATMGDALFMGEKGGGACFERS